MANQTDSGKYWSERMEALDEKQYQKSQAYYQDLQEQFRRAKNEIQMDIEQWYWRLADNNGISLAAAKRLLKKNELEEFQWTIEQYIKYGEKSGIDPKWMKQLENASARYHISYLETLKCQMQQHVERLMTEYEGGITDFLHKTYAENYYHSAYEIAKGTGVGSNLVQLDDKSIDVIIKKPWAQDGKNFSDRIWTNKQKLTSNLHTELSQCIIRGEEPAKAIQQLSKIMDVSEGQAGRLVMTEAAAISSMAKRDCFRELDVEEFQFVATLDNHTSALCQSMDGKHFKMSDYQIGVNVPPLHCWCRSCTVPYFADEFTEGEQRAARNEEGKTYYVPSDMTYKEWQESFVKEGKIGLQEIALDDIINLENFNASLQMNPREADALTEWIENLEGNEQQKWITAFAETDYELFPEGLKEAIPHFDPNKNIVYLHLTDDALTVVHETAHAIDEGAMCRKVIEHVGSHNFEWEINSASMNVQELSKPYIDSDIESIAKYIGVTVDKGHFTCSNADVICGFEKYANNILNQFPDDRSAFSCVSDIISGMTDDLTNGSKEFGGHSKEYWQSGIQGNGAFMVNIEAWADFCALKVSKNKNMLSVLKNIVPGMYEALEQTYREIFD